MMIKAINLQRNREELNHLPDALFDDTDEAIYGPQKAIHYSHSIKSNQPYGRVACSLPE
jgi:hypothetical protein